jgi:NADH-quinone oxidoreductase subunit G
MSKMINFTIDGQKVSVKKGETILDAARQNNIYIPTMCHLAKATPIASCRLCEVEVEGHDGFVLGCNTQAVEGINVTTNSDALFKERQNIMKLYDVNHPLQCGVCDKSGECDLQNKTLEFDVDTQNFAVREHARKKKKWGVLSYDPHLCIMCERCTVVCNEVVGTMALYIKPGGYKSLIDNHFGACIECGECIDVCPVGAMASSDFKYKTNAWELTKIPSSCAHCSSACNLNYEVKHTSIENIDTTIYRVTNDVALESLCGAGRFGYDFENRVEGKDKVAFEKAVSAFKEADTILFNSMITNEEAMVLQSLKVKHGYKLVNNDARNFQAFLENASTISGKKLYSGNIKTIEASDFAITLGTSVAGDNPMIRYALNIAQNKRSAYITYMHPLEDESLRNVITQYVKYEVGSEEGILAMLADLVVNEEARETFKSFFDSLDSGYICGESSIGEEEFGLLYQKLRRKTDPVLVIGADLYNHENAQNIAKLVGMIDKYSNFNVIVIPPETNSLGVAMICALDEKPTGKTVGYNVKGDFTLASIASANLENYDLDMPALNQQEGTFTSLDKKVVPLNVAVPFKGYELNDIANVLEVEQENVINYTAMLPQTSGFKNIEFDDIENRSTMMEVIRGYELDNVDTTITNAIDEVSELKEYNGTVIYRNNRGVSSFNPYTNIAHQTIDDVFLVGSKQFATAAKIKGGNMVRFEMDGVTYERKFKVDSKLKGTMAINSVLDSTASYGEYRYKQVKLEVVDG